MTDRAEIAEAMKVVAQIIARDGAAYLPAFVRLEAEATRQSVTQSALERALFAARAA